MTATEEALARKSFETIAGQYLPQVMERQSNYFDLFLKEGLTHLVERVIMVSDLLSILTLASAGKTLMGW